MKIVRLIPLACLVSLLAACGADSVTGPDTRPAAEPPRYETAGSGIGGLGSGN